MKKHRVICTSYSEATLKHKNIAAQPESVCFLEIAGRGSPFLGVWGEASWPCLGRWSLPALRWYLGRQRPTQNQQTHSQPEDAMGAVGGVHAVRDNQRAGVFSFHGCQGEVKYLSQGHAGLLDGRLDVGSPGTSSNVICMSATSAVRNHRSDSSRVYH